MCFHSCDVGTFYCLEDNMQNRITENNGTIKTLYAGDSSYRKEQECTWFIDAGTNKNTKVQFTVVQSELEWVPEDSICVGYDYIQIRNGLYNN